MVQQENGFGFGHGDLSAEERLNQVMSELQDGKPLFAGCTGVTELLSLQDGHIDLEAFAASYGLTVGEDGVLAGEIGGATVTIARDEQGVIRYEAHRS